MSLESAAVPGAPAEQVEIILRRQKAYLVRQGDRAAWIMRRGWKYDGSAAGAPTKGTLKKLAAAKPGSAEKLERTEQERRARGAAFKKATEDPTHIIRLTTIAKAKRMRFAVVDDAGNPVWYGLDFNKIHEQSAADLASAKKCVWLANKIRELHAPADARVRLEICTSAQWLTFQDDREQRGYELTAQASKYGIGLWVVWLSLSDNPADRLMAADGYQKWGSPLNNLPALLKPATGQNNHKGEKQ